MNNDSETYVDEFDRQANSSLDVAKATPAEVMKDYIKCYQMENDAMDNGIYKTLKKDVINKHLSQRKKFETLRLIK